MRANGEKKKRLRIEEAINGQSKLGFLLFQLKVLCVCVCECVGLCGRFSNFASSISCQAAACNANL